MSEETKKLVLIADDDERMLISLEALLQDEGYETATAWGGRQALELLGSKEFDLVLLNEYLSDVGTEAVLEHMQGLASQPLTVVMRSSQPSPDSLPPFASFGVREVVDKRMPHRQFSDAVREWMGAAVGSA
jgi:DNA-binding NtrC family response regulator